MLRLPAITVTTAALPSAYPWHAVGALPGLGVPIGVNRSTGGTVFRYDPWRLYAAGVVSSPNLVVLGQLGTGKSALVKTYLSRQLAAGRDGYVLDPKGEYAPLAARHRLPVLRLGPGAPPVNLLAGTAGEADAGRHDRRVRLLETLAATGLRRPLHPTEQAGLAAAARRLVEPARLRQLTESLLAPTDGLARELHVSPAAAASALRDTAFTLARLLDGPLARLLDGPAPTAAARDGGGLVVDLSAVFADPATLALAMAAVTGWLTPRLTAPGSRRRLLVVDEVWALLAEPATTRWLQSLSKLARAHGAQLITVVHRSSDLTAQDDAHTAAMRQAQGLLADAGTRVLYGQAPGERVALRDLFALPPAAVATVAALPPYRALWCVGAHRAVVDHLLLDDEAALVDTDTAMRP